MDWIIQNKEWLFSGVLISVPLAVIGWFLGTKASVKRKQTQKSGDNSVNIQVGGNLKLKGGIKNSEPKPKSRK